MIKTILVTAILVGTTAAMAAPTFQPQGPEGYQEAAIAGPTGRSKRCRVLNMAARGYTTRCYTRGGRNICYRVPMQRRVIVCS